MSAQYVIVELSCDIDIPGGQWSGRLGDGRSIFIRNDTFEATVEIETVGGADGKTVYRDCLYRGLSVDEYAIAVSVICANAGIALRVKDIEGVA